MDADLRRRCKGYADDVVAAYNNGELYDYISENVYDVELRIDPEKRLRSVQLMVAGGGPTIYIDTKERAILGYWGGIEVFMLSQLTFATTSTRSMQRFMVTTIKPFYYGNRIINSRYCSGFVSCKE